ncbi:pyridoxamine 5'-phosphate oxidase family protein [Desulfitibacter alkalitolerans]|uniref:pyridoxamine 5'-phosphate oxidase family protein n=1 Tax=Desulfitibacter alkalitolerans TaxID=264641 RepID=UPI000488DBBF|nr:pyridoxamine 5'-phosphate oxidase family protein [Desulfitibacter alkalitolerans]
MSLKEYFEEAKGVGILSTADENGVVDAAVYATPHVFDDETVAFIMRDRLSYHNVSKNPKACYLFLENSPGYMGKRLYLTKIREEKNSEQLFMLRRRNNAYDATKENLFLVTFNVDEVLPIICKE